MKKIPLRKYTLQNIISSTFWSGLIAAISPSIITDNCNETKMIRITGIIMVIISAIEAAIMVATEKQN